MSSVTDLEKENWNLYHCTINKLQVPLKNILFSCFIWHASFLSNLLIKDLFSLPFSRLHSVLPPKAWNCLQTRIKVLFFKYISMQKKLDQLPFIFRICKKTYMPRKLKGQPKCGPLITKQYNSMASATMPLHIRYPYKVI